MKRTHKIILIILTILLLLTLIIANPYALITKSQQAEKAAGYLENYYSINGQYPSVQNFYEKFNKKLKYESNSKHHYSLYYRVERINNGFFGTPIAYNEMFSSHIRYYVSSCDTARRCDPSDFNRKHNRNTPYDFISGITAPPVEDPNMMKIYTWNWSIHFYELTSGEDDFYDNLTYDPLFYNLEETDVRDYHKRSLNPTGRLGETTISYDKVHCTNISMTDCNSTKSVTMNLEIDEMDMERRFL